MRSQIGRILILGFAGVLGSVAAFAQATEMEVAAKLKGKPLYLRGLWVDDNLVFDASGMPKGKYKSLPFTEAGVDVYSVKLKGDDLEIEGQRMALAFDAKERMKRVRLTTGTYSGIIRIKVEGGPGADYGKALDAIFAPDLESLTPSLPIYWQSYAQKHFLPAGATPTTATAAVAGNTPMAGTGELGDGKKLMHVGGPVTPPRVLQSVDPAFTAVARALKFSGNVQVYLWVLPDGSASHVRIAKPAGMGLDEAAMASVLKYRFTPAMKDGEPVTVDLYIDVNFQIF